LHFVVLKILSEEIPPISYIDGKETWNKDNPDFLLKTPTEVAYYLKKKIRAAPEEKKKL